jgi:hypothetical protein
LKNIEDGISSRLQNIETLQSKQNSLERSLSQMTKHIESKAVFRPLTAEEKTVPYQLSTVAFPTLISARLTGGDMSAFIPGGTASGFLGLGGSAFKSVTISIPQAYTAFLDEAVIKDLVGIKMDHNVHQKLDLTLNHAANADDSCLENILNNSLLVRKLSRNEKTFWIVIRRAAYYTTEIDVKLERNASTVASGQLNLDIAGSQALFNKGLEQLKLTDAVKTPGGQFTVYHSGSDFIGMSRQFEMPIAIGSNFLMLKLKKVGDTYNVLDVVDY